MPYGNLSSNSDSTMKFSLTSPDWSKVLFKDNYRKKYSVASYQLELVPTTPQP
jgi:hypothetical protein